LSAKTAAPDAGRAGRRANARSGEDGPHGSGASASAVLSLPMTGEGRTTRKPGSSKRFSRSALAAFQCRRRRS